MIMRFCKDCGADILLEHDGVIDCGNCGARFRASDLTRMAVTQAMEDQILVHYVKATEYMNRGDHKREMEELQKALAIDPNNADTVVRIGRCYRAQGQNTMALDTYEKAIAIDPTCGTAYTNTATILVLMQQYAAAGDQYRKGLPFLDKNTDDYWIAYANYAICVAKQGGTFMAESMIKEAEQHGYKNGDACRKLAGLKKRGLFR